MIKHIIKTALILFLCFIIYEIAGALLPFAHMKQVGEAFQADFDPSVFYGEGSTERAAVVETNAEALDTRLQMIEQADERIILSTFDIRDGRSTRDIFSSLLNAANRGVRVQVVVDGLYGSVHMNGIPIFYAAGSHPNIEIKFYNIPSLLKPWTINGRMHDKYLIVDDDLLLTGGRNTFDYFLGDYDTENPSFDRDILIVDTAPAGRRAGESAVDQFDGYFRMIWNSPWCETVLDAPPARMEKKITKARSELDEHYKKLISDRPELTKKEAALTAGTVPIKKATLIHNPIGIYAKEPWVWHQIQYLMARAKKRAYIQTPYAALSKDMYAGLAEAVGNVPETALLLNATSVGDNFMASSDYTLNRKKILDTGVKLYEYFGEHSSHGKSILIDENLSLIGSYNLDMRSTYVDTETMLVIHGEEFNRQLEGQIKHMEDQALRVRSDGRYEEKAGVTVKELTAGKKFVFFFTSRIFQLFRYLI